jgi:cytidylate kinase
MIRMLLVGYCFGIRSERRLCEEVHLNLAYRWFCRLGLDGKVPDHSTFSKNRHGRFRDSDAVPLDPEPSHRLLSPRRPFPGAPRPAMRRDTALAGRRPPMSIVTISAALGSAGDVVGRALAEELSYTFADREIILKAAERLGQGVAELEQLLESRPTLRERLLETRRDYLAAVEAVIWEFAARDNVVLVGRGSTFVLQRLRHAFRVRVTAPLHVRARRLEAERGLVPDAEEVVAKSDRDWAARIRHLYDAGLDDPLQYDLVLNTARLDPPTAVA